MSYINAYRVSTEEQHGVRDETVLVEGLHEGNTLFSATDGEELYAASSIIGLVDALDNGEALVITKVVF